MGNTKSFDLSERWDKLPSKWKFGLSTGLLIPCICLYVAVLAIVGMVWWRDPEEMFHENAPSTWMSVTLLFVCSLVAWANRGRWQRVGDPAWHVWTHVAIVFFIAALDDWFRFHESLDDFRAWLMGVSTNHPVWGNIDYALVAVYGVYSLFIAWRYRRALLPIRPLIMFGTAGAVVFTGMVLADAWYINGWLEDGCKLVAAALFLAALLAAFWWYEDGRQVATQ